MNPSGILTLFSHLFQNQFEEIERTRHSIEQQKNIERVAIDNKLKTAANMRDENIKKMLERLREHVSVVLRQSDCVITKTAFVNFKISFSFVFGFHKIGTDLQLNVQ